MNYEKNIGMLKYAFKEHYFAEMHINPEEAGILLSARSSLVDDYCVYQPKQKDN